LASAAACAARPLEEEQFPSWSASYVDRLLTDSPWSRPLTVSFRLQSLAGVSEAFFPGAAKTRSVEAPQGTGARTEIYLTARWASALPIRQASALQDFGRSGLDSPEAIQRLTEEPKEYVLELAGFPAVLFKQGSQVLEEALTRTATLSIAGRPPIAANEVTVPAQGMHMMATLRFPRQASLQPSDGAITLAASVNTMRIEQPFKLKSMVYRSRLEL